MPVFRIIIDQFEEISYMPDGGQLAKRIEGNTGMNWGDILSFMPDDFIDFEVDKSFRQLSKEISSHCLN